MTAEPPPLSRRALLGLAALNASVHVAAIAVAALGMRPGTPGAPLEERLRFLAASPPGWTLGWGLWMLCAIADFAYIAALAAHVRPASALAALAVTLATVGAAVDLIWDTVHILVMPQVAALQPPAPGLFLALERMAWSVGAVVANSFYSVATLVVTLALSRAGQVGRASLALAAATAFCGGLLAVAGFTGDPRHLEWVSGPTIGAFVAWTAATARDLTPRAVRAAAPS